MPPALEQARRYWSSWKDRAVAEHGSQSSLFSDQVGMCDPDRIGIYDHRGNGGRRRDRADL